MKRILFFTLSLCLLGSKTIFAQCSGGPGACTITAGTISSVATKIETVGSNCVTTVNVSFDLGHNGGLKWVPLYFYDNVLPAGVCGSTPAASSNPLAFAMLEYTGGINFNISSTSLNSIVPQTGYTITTSAITGGTRINIIGLKLTRPGSCVTSQVAVYIGAENSSGPGVKCYSSSSFTAYQLFISGKVDCTSPRNYDLLIDTDYKSGTSSAPISGNYDVFIDVNDNNLIDGTEASTPVITGASFNTSILSSTLNRFASFDNFYGSTTLGDVITSKKLLVRVTPLPSFNVAPLVGRLANLCGTLPVTLKNFNAKLNNNIVALTWETADEINNKGFEIQRRLNGEGSYQKIAFVDAKATQGLGASYSFTDASVRNKGSVSYRLAQTDVDGKISLSDIRVVNTGSGNSHIAVYPNPSKGSVNISIPTQLSKADISLEDFSGKTIQRWNGYGANLLQINQIRPGIYLIRVQLQETGEQIIERLIVQ